MESNAPVCPEHIAIIMDGNGRWAKQRNLPRIAGHKAGVKALQHIVECAAKRHIRILTVYAFSRENWRRLDDEVNLLLELFVSSLKSEIHALDKNNVRLRFIGDLSRFPDKLRFSIADSERRTEKNTGLLLNVAVNYGGRWELTRAVANLFEKVAHRSLAPADINEELLAGEMALSDCPDPELFIRSGGERRISNYLLWQLAYTELYFSDVLWPDFDAAQFDFALEWFSNRQRRFGRTSEQLEQHDHA